jgi:hypothetical protein
MIIVSDHCFVHEVPNDETNVEYFGVYTNGVFLCDSSDFWVASQAAMNDLFLGMWLLFSTRVSKNGC